MSFTIKKIREINFVNNNLPNDCRVSYKMIVDVDLEEELEQFEKAFEKDEIVNSLIAENIFKVYLFAKIFFFNLIFQKQTLKFLRSGL